MRFLEQPLAQLLDRRVVVGFEEALPYQRALRRLAKLLLLEEVLESPLLVHDGDYIRGRSPRRRIGDPAIGIGATLLPKTPISGLTTDGGNQRRTNVASGVVVATGVVE